MYSKIAGILFPIFAVAVIGLGMWGYQENQEKNSILIKAENQYQRAFHDLTYNMDQLQDELGKTLAVNSRKQVDGTLSNVWRITSMAQSDVGQLPLNLMPFSKTEEFLSKIGDFSYQAAVRDLDKEPLSEKEYQTLKTLYHHASDIQTELRNVQNKVLNDHLRWMDVETALASEDEKLDNTIIDGFRTIDKTVNEYGDMNLGPGIQSTQMNMSVKADKLKGKPITEEQARSIAMKFVGVTDSQAKVEVKKTGKGYKYQGYSVAITKPNSPDGIHLDITQRGGHVVWMLDNKEIKTPKLTIEQARKNADQFLKTHGYANMEPTMFDTYGNMAVLTYVYNQDKVRMYPDLVTVKVALDTGKVNGFQSEEYTFNHKQRKLAKPKLSMEQARTMVNPNFKVSESRLAVILNDQNKEVLCYEFVGSVEKQLFRVYINADNGHEENVEKMDGAGKNK